MKQFAYEARSIPPALLNTLYEDTRQYHPNGCNECSTGRLAVWVAPGDPCTLRRNGSLAEYPQFQHLGCRECVILSQTPLEAFQQNTKC